MDKNILYPYLWRNLMVTMKFLIILPTHNEENNIYFCLNSLEKQIFQDFKIVIVNDGSTDNTSTEIQKFLSQSKVKDRIEVIHLEKSEHQPGAKVIRTFYTGLNSQNWRDFDIICKFDADIIFPPNYLLDVEQTYTENPNVGMVSGLVKIKKNPNQNDDFEDFSNKENLWIFENISSKQHIRGPIKSYRRACFEQMNGLREVLGWDNIDVLLAKKNNWQIIAIQHLWVKHLRPTAYQYKSQKAKKLGEYFYNLGLHFPLAMISALKSAWKSKSVLEFFLIMQSFMQQKHNISLSEEEIRFIRNLKTKEILRKLRFQSYI